MRLLNELGYGRVRDFRGGLAEWTERGGELARAAGRSEDEGEPPASTPTRGPASSRERPWFFQTIDALSVHGWLVSWAGMVVGCGIVYWLAGATGGGLESDGEPVATSFGGLLTALYFSVVTATTLGFGDVVPVGPVRLLAVAEAAAGLVVFGVVVAKVVSKRQDELVREIHAVTLEERLGRVLSNLHLTIAEESTLARLCSQGGATARATLGRFESVMRLLTSELRTVRRLLHRPADRVQEESLEAILATLATALRELDALVSCAPDVEGLDESLEGIATLAEEICAECVPVDHTPALESWMDDVRERARSLTANRG